MAIRKKFDITNPKTWVPLVIWLAGTAIIAYYAHVWEWSTSPQTAKEIAEARDRFSNLNPEYSLARVVTYTAFGSVLLYAAIRYLKNMVVKKPDNMVVKKPN